MLWLLSRKIENAVFVVVVFHERQNPELLRGYPYFRNVLLIFMIFRNKCGRAIMVGMYVPIRAWKISNTLGSFSFLRSNFSLVLANSFQAKVACHHQQVMVTSNVCSWKTSCSGNVHSWSEALPHQNVINLVVVLSIWAMPCPSSDALWWPNMFANTRSSKVANSRSLGPLSFVSSLQKGPQNALPVSTSVLAHFCIPVSLHNKNMLLLCLINDNL